MSCYFPTVAKMIASALGLFFGVVRAVVLTHFFCFKELFHFLIYDKKQKCVKNQVVVVS